jgi:hypothetical protein
MFDVDRISKMAATASITISAEVANSIPGIDAIAWYLDLDLSIQSVLK